MYFLKIIRSIWKKDPDFPKLKPRLAHGNYEKKVLCNEKMCAACKGLCCKQNGCAFSPFDFEEISYEYLKKLIIDTGYICIRYVSKLYSGQGTGVFYLAVRNKYEEVFTMNERIGTGCSLLTADGCLIGFERRPTGGKLLMPHGYVDEEGEMHVQCEQMYNLYDCCYEWLPYKKTLQKLAYEFVAEDSGVPDY